MKRRFFGAVLIVLAASLAGCATRDAGYAYGGGYYLDECELGQDCYGGYQYTCVFFRPDAPAARMDINQVRRSHSPRTVDPRFDATGMASSGSGSSSSSASAPVPAPAVAREPVVLAAPAVDRGGTRTRD